MSNEANHTTNDYDARRAAVIFDLDGVLTDTAELHYQSWKEIADELGVPFGRQANEALRGLSRLNSLELMLGAQAARFSHDEKLDIAKRKNDAYLQRVERMSPADLLPGAAALVEALRARGVAVAVASSSKNAHIVIEHLGIRDLLDTLVDGNDAPHSKPDPQVFLLAAERLGVPPIRCVVIEDAASGVQAALTAGMRVVGIGPAERVAGANLIVARIAELTPDAVLALLST